ncbi:translation initiation factor eIF3 subunit g [Pichia californica]|uniref:Eukaryotic translation initiation factor 3 subunit G n=1 Tax=Pichia californica TaxID=460514 RepID=A0A9P7BFG7_9ASCO|nr:translation initiation factor eIF3 subunit g [[Candida] californica]KAG0690527.1 translation initiation factor eIF3 subunit g [[Candida] californica]
MSSNWADAEAELPQPLVTDNGDGTKTIVSYRYNDQHKKVKVTQKIKFVKSIETVNPLVAKRTHWKRFGIEKDNKTIGPDSKTTQITEEVKLILSTTWKADEEKEQEKSKNKLTKSTFKCRVCGGTGHYSAKCPYKDTFGSDSLLKPNSTSDGTNNNNTNSNNPANSSLASDNKPSGSFSSRYVPPNMRSGIDASSNNGIPAEVPALRVTNLNSAIDRDALQSIVSRFGNYDRVSVLKNRETGESLGVAFVNMATLKGAEAVKEALDGRGLMNMILSVDWARPK